MAQITNAREYCVHVTDISGMAIFNHACDEISPLQLMHGQMKNSHKCEIGKGRYFSHKCEIGKGRVKVSILVKLDCIVTVITYMCLRFNHERNVLNTICYLIFYNTNKFTINNFSANTKHLYTICTTSAQLLRRWSNIVQMLYKCFVFTGLV